MYVLLTFVRDSELSFSKSKTSKDSSRYDKDYINVYMYIHYVGNHMLTKESTPLKGNFAIFYMLAKYVPGDIKYIFTKFYRHISTNNEANRKFVILISNFSTRL